MKTSLKNIGLIVVATLFVGVLLGWLIFGDSKNDSIDKLRHSNEIETVWTCSMHPQIRMNEHGFCPICGMELIPINSDSNASLNPAVINMSPTAMQLANVSTQLVGKMKPIKLIRLNGKIQEDERLVYTQSSHIPGRIESLKVNFTGEYVNKGQRIATIYSPDLVNAQEELFEAQKLLETQPQLFSAAKEKLRNWKLSNAQIENILASGTPNQELPIYADVSGNITQKMVNLGDYVKRGEAIYEIANLNKVWIMFDIYESDIAWVKKGDIVNFTIESLRGEKFEGAISYVDPVINSVTRVAQARIEVSNKDQQLKPEMFVSGIVEAKLPIKSNAIVIPKTAVMWTGERSVVYVKSFSTTGVNFVMREITLGPSLGDSYIVKKGLEEGEEIAVNGTFSIDASAQLAGKASMMNPEGNGAITGHNHGVTPMTSSDESSMESMQSKSVISVEAKNALQPIYIHYFEMKDALAKDDFEDAKEYGRQILMSVDAVNMSIFKGESHTVWMTLSSDIKNELQHIGEQKEIGGVRKSFQNVSNTIITMTNVWHPYNKTLYVLHCPMVDNNKGADWISLSKKIENPYFGKEMSTCGEVKTTF